MSLWMCPIHGLYGGDVFCPSCGGGGEYVTIPSRDGDASLAEDPKGLSGEAVAARASEGGIAR